MTDPADMQVQLKILSDAYALQLPEKLKLIEQAWNHLPRSEWSENGFQALYRMVHSMTGSGKMFGFSLLSDVARNLEAYLNRLAQAQTPPNDEQRQCIQILLDELHQATTTRDAISIEAGQGAVLPFIE
jgi:chemotaxis protein histidine kinase CheA